MTDSQTTPRIASGEPPGQVVPYDVSGISGSRAWTDPASEPADLPPTITLRAILRAYEGDPERHRALRDERGLRPPIGRKYGIGWSARDGAWVLPVRNERGELVNLSYRPPHHQKHRHPWRVAGRLADNGGLPLYPGVPKGNAWVLCAGEWDALATIQAGLPAVTGLIGCRWHTAWDALARGKRVAVLYDRGEEEAAERTVERLLCVGASSAWVVTLDGPAGYDPCAFFLEGGTTPELLRLIKAARP